MKVIVAIPHQLPAYTIEFDSDNELPEIAARVYGRGANFNYEKYDVLDGEMYGSYSEISASDLKAWREEGRYSDLFDLLDRGVTRILEVTYTETSGAEYFDADDPKAPSEKEAAWSLITRDLNSAYLFETQQEAWEWAKNYTGHQAYRVRAELGV